jgi:hypothetical protein
MPKNGESFSENKVTHGSSLHILNTDKLFPSLKNGIFRV